MPRLLRDFRCESCGSEQERYIDSDIEEIDCMWCSGTAHRVIGMPHVSLEGITGAFPGAADHWAKIREDRHKKNAKRNSK